MEACCIRHIRRYARNITVRARITLCINNKCGLLNLLFAYRSFRNRVVFQIRIEFSLDIIARIRVGIARLDDIARIIRDLCIRRCAEAEFLQNICLCISVSSRIGTTRNVETCCIRHIRRYIRHITIRARIACRIHDQRSLLNLLLAYRSFRNRVVCQVFLEGRLDVIARIRVGIACLDDFALFILDLCSRRRAEAEFLQDICLRISIDRLIGATRNMEAGCIRHIGRYIGHITIGTRIACRIHDQCSLLNLLLAYRSFRNRIVRQIFLEGRFNVIARIRVGIACLDDFAILILDLRIRRRAEAEFPQDIRFRISIDRLVGTAGNVEAGCIRYIGRYIGHITIRARIACRIHDQIGFFDSRCTVCDVNGIVRQIFSNCSLQLIFSSSILSRGPLSYFIRIRCITSVSIL